MFARLAAQEQQTDYRQSNSGEPRPGGRFTKKYDSRDRQDRRANRENDRYGREWPAFLEKKEKRNRTGADADPGEN